MKKLLFAFAVIVFTIPAHANKIATGTYHTSEQRDKVFTSILRILTQERYSIRFTDGSQGTVQANKTTRLDGAEWASVFIMVSKEGDGTIVEATFTRHAATFFGGSPIDWAKTFGENLKMTFPELTEKLEKK